MLYPIQKSLYIGGRLFDASEVQRFESGTTGVILYGQVGTDTRVSTLRRANVASGFQVPSTKTLTVKALLYSSGASARLTVGYGDTDVGNNSASAPTNPVTIGGSTTVSAPWAYVSTNTANNPPAGIFIDFQVPQNKYPYVYAEGATFTSAIVYCFID